MEIVELQVLFPFTEYIPLPLLYDKNDNVQKKRIVFHSILRLKTDWDTVSVILPSVA